MHKWTHHDISDQTGRITIITGANSGLGFAAASALAQKNATVIMACRNINKGEAAAAKIRALSNDARLSVMKIDLASLSSVRKFADEFKTRFNRIDHLLNNAGVMAPPYSKTSDGFELQFGINHLGHFALTGLVLDLLLKTGNSRIVTMSSGAHYMGSMDFDNLNWGKGYSPWPAYGRSKLANLLFTYQLQRKLESVNTDSKALAAHPGYAATNLQRNSFFFRIFNPLFAQKPEKGAWPMLYAATADNVRGGEYYGPDGLFQLHGHPQKVQSSKESYNQDRAGKLWDISEKLTGISFNI
ncbi:MAG: SDR family NAD(P)-dependent oxidoreductase [Chitinivibrionales bacterium]|nr:SDR family NAD(P)-dependent oxidoreductase [Chitinivibrionales bacterium]